MKKPQPAAATAAKNAGGTKREAETTPETPPTSGGGSSGRNGHRQGEEGVDDMQVDAEAKENSSVQLPCDASDDEDLLDELPNAIREDLTQDELAHMEWWDTVSWKEVLGLQAPTTAFVPDGVRHAVATLKWQLCEHISRAKVVNCVEDECRGWKALLSCDAFLFHDVKGKDGASRRGVIADRIKLLEQGHWGVLWTHVDSCPVYRASEEKSEIIQCVGKVTKLMEANEISKAASAVWGAGSAVPVEAV